MSDGDRAPDRTASTDYPDSTEEKLPRAESVASGESVDGFSANGIERRDALRAMAAAVGALPVLDAAFLEAQGTPTTRPAVQAPAPPSGPRGGPWDPDLVHPRPGTWPRQLSAGELITLSALCDAIIPADAQSPRASAVGVPAWINEYVSAPYEGQQNALVRVRGGLSWLNLESNKRFGRPFVRLSEGERTQICDDICYLPNAKSEFRSAARFFDLVRDLSAVGFYTTHEGMRDIGYIGNVPLPKFPEVSPALRAKLGVV